MAKQEQAAHGVPEAEAIVEDVGRRRQVHARDPGGRCRGDEDRE